MRVGTPCYYAPTWRVLLTVSLAALAFPSHASEQTSTDQAVIEALKAQISALTERLDALESKSTIPTQTYSNPTPTTTPATPASWADNIKLKGDFRYRHEAFDIEFRDERHRQRIRARPELQATLSDTVKVGFGLATGNLDPTSTNQTLTNASSSKNVVIDLAYANWQTPIEGLSTTIGKFKNPLHRAGSNGLVCDSDVRPEGLGAQYEAGALFANALGIWMDESSSGQDALMLGGQVGLNSNLGDGKLLSGVGYYHYTDAENREPYLLLPLGNRTNPDGTYFSDFHLAEAFLEYQFAFANNKVTVFADYVKNIAADDYDTAWALGAKLKRTDWSLGWAYQELEADSVLGIATDSDFIGGGTDGKGHILQAGYALTKNIGLNGTLFLTERNMDFGTEADFKRLMLDINFKY